MTFTSLQSISCVSLHPTDDLAIEDPTTTLTLAISSLDVDLDSPQTAMLSVMDNDGKLQWANNFTQAITFLADNIFCF